MCSAPVHQEKTGSLPFYERNLYTFAPDMPSRLLLPVLFLALLVAACGCMQTVPATSSPIAPETTAPPVAATATAPPSVTTAPAPPADPIIGSWIGYQYTASGRYQKVWVFRENSTWTMTNTNQKSRTTKDVNGKWTRTGTTTYEAAPSGGAPDTFTYDPEKDLLTDTYFQGTYTRFSGSLLASTPLPSLEVTLHSAQAVLAINGSHPNAGNRYLILNISITNVNATAGFAFSDDNARVTTPEMPVSKAINRKLAGKLENPFPTGKVAAGETRQGNVIFGIPAASASFTFRLIDDSGNAISNVVMGDAIRRNATYSESPG